MDSTPSGAGSFPLSFCGSFYDFFTISVFSVLNTLKLIWGKFVFYSLLFPFKPILGSEAMVTLIHPQAFSPLYMQCQSLSVEEQVLHVLQPVSLFFWKEVWCRDSIVS